MERHLSLFTRHLSKSFFSAVGLPKSVAKIFSSTS